MQALTLLNDGKLDAAIDAAIEHVRNHPADTAGREVLAELFCQRGDYERADKQCETIIVQYPQAALAVSLLRQLIRAEKSRRECWHEGRLPEFVGEPGEECKQTMAALLALRQGQANEASEILAKFEEQRTPLAGFCNDQPFDDFRDLDDCCAHIWEVLTSTGKYFWIPTSRIISAEFLPVSRPRDLHWRQCEMAVDDGPTGVVYIPTLYIQTDQTADSPERLGRATQWLEEDASPVRGVGQRLFLAGDVELGILELTTLEFSRPE